MSIATQVLSFENFGALESHLKILKNKYAETIKKYEETLGFILRDTKPTSVKTQKVQEKWALEMQRAMATTAAAKNAQMAKKEEKPKGKMFGGNKDKDRDDKLESTGKWIALDPMSLFIGQRTRGMAEIYFDTINVLKENVAKINQALSVCSALRAKAATAGSTSLVVSFINDIPVKVMLKPVSAKETKKYNLAFSFAVAGMPAAAKSLVVK